MTDVRNHANLVWGIAELLRGDYKQADYGKVILPLVVIRRLDQTLCPSTRSHAYADARVNRSFGGSNEVMLEIVGRSLGLGEPRS